MSEINLRLKAEALGKSLDNLSNEVEQNLQEAIRSVVNSGYASIEGSAELQLHSTRQDYLKGLSLHEISDGDFLIILEGKFANALEEGYSGFDVKQGMLGSKKIVEVGPRSGQPWVQKSKGDEHRFAHVPFQHRPFSQAAKSSDLGAAIRKLKAFNVQGVEQKFTQIFRDASGNPIEGKVAVARKVPGFPELDRLTKYQKKYQNEKTGEETIQSTYMTFRTVSDVGDEWTHPGHPGLHFFDDAEEWMDKQIDNILERLIK